MTDLIWFPIFPPSKYKNLAVFAEPLVDVLATGDLPMTNLHTFHGPVAYRIKLKGRLDPEWSDWFDQMAISTAGGTTILNGPLADQAALHGVLMRIRDLNLTLLSVERIEPARPEKP